MVTRNGGYTCFVVASLNKPNRTEMQMYYEHKIRIAMKNAEMFYRNGVLYITTTPDNTHIENSYIVKSRSDMRGILRAIESCSNSDDAIRRIGINTMIREWRAHNLLYALGIARARTKDVDLNFESWWRRIGYFVLSLMYWRI